MLPASSPDLLRSAFALEAEGGGRARPGPPRMSAAASTPPAGDDGDTRLTAFPLLRWMPWAAAAALALTCGWLALKNVALRADNSALRTERELAEIACKQARGQLAERTLLAERMINDLGTKLQRVQDLAHLKVSALAAPAGNTKEVQAIAVWDPDRAVGLLTVARLPALPANKDYQIWVIDPAYPNPVNGGVFTVASDGLATLTFKPDQPVRQATRFAISLEKKGGVPKAEGPIVLLSQ